MCGIFCCIHNLQKGDKLLNYDFLEWNFCKEKVSSRGPDSLFEKRVSLSDACFGYFAASILWTQGSKMTIQPCIDEDGNILLWNGDVFSGDSIESSESDTCFILKAFKLSSVFSTLQKVKGPYSFIYYENSSKLLYFARDLFGRHSLLINLNDSDNSLTFTSVTCRDLKKTIEVPAIGVFALSLLSLDFLDLNLTCFPWRTPNNIFNENVEKLKTFFKSSIKIGEVFFPSKEESFSLVDIDEQYFHVNSNSKSSENKMESLLLRKDIFEKVKKLENLLKTSVGIRIKKQPSYCTNCIKLILNNKIVKCTHTKVGILFSGGLDSTILAVIADEFIPENESIDLINVAFEKSKASTSQTEGEMYNVPDRKTGRQSLSELEEICPNRNWNFVEVNVPQEELNAYRTSHISDLVYPLGTILDESLGCALWFASRGNGFLKGQSYESTSRILLLGMGADELFGGYMRHRTILRRKGWKSLIEELQLELNRISDRNLGRDDRVTSDHGKQARFPYLDENLVEYVQSLPPWERCCPNDDFPCGLGDKLILRLVARKLNLKNAANFPKRAFQFGSRIANAKENAKDLSNRL